MKDNFLFPNNSYEENGEGKDNNSLFQINSNVLFPNQDTSNYFNNIVQLNDEGDEQKYNIDEYNVGDLENNNFEKSLKIDLFKENENNLNKDFSPINPIPDNEDDYKINFQLLSKNYGNNETYTGLENDFFEIRCKIFAYNNYYDNKVSTTFYFR